MARLLPGLYAAPSRPRHWIVVTVEGSIVMVPVTAAGWTQRQRYQGPLQGLQTVDPAIVGGVLLSAGILPAAIAWEAGDYGLLTPAEIAVQTATGESTWRNRAAAGEFPGAFKKGKQWLIPRIVLQRRGILPVEE